MPKTKPLAVSYPDLKDIYADTIKWEPAWKPGGKQSFTPLDKDILLKLGMSPNEDVLCVAAAHGDWANALAAAGANVTLSDASKDMVEFAKKRYHGAFKKTMTLNALFAPARPGKYDWSFHFEPHPFRETALPLSLARSLTNRKGGVLVHGKPFNFSRGYNGVAKIYGIRPKVANLDISGKSNMQWEEPGEAKMRGIFLKTNPRVKRMADIDVRVIRHLNAGAGSLGELRARLSAGGMKTQNKELVRSLKRVSKLSGLVQKKYVVKKELPV